MPQCPNEDILERFFVGACGDEESSVLLTHFEACDSCRRWLSEAMADEDVLASVRRVAGVEEQPPTVARSNASDAIARRLHSVVLPERIGSYTIIRLIGEGGMGSVYEAEQERPRRRVALKVMRESFPSATALRRFEHEAQILGRLQHPGIAQIFEAGASGTTSGSRAYLAMELIDGPRLTDHANARLLGTRERLALLGKVAEAVHHAHTRGVIHRDLKPANILVDKSGQPKILDFGIARVMDSDIAVTTLQTDVGQLVGTIPYMSPEQVTGNPAAIDTRTDVYALGVIGYEMLAGRLPHDLRTKMIPEAVRVIRDEDPTPLSSINRIFRGDIQTIISKALEKDRSRRYQSAAELQADLERYLRGEPIVARQASAAYQFRKFAGRNKALVCGVLIAAIGLMGGAITAVWKAAEAVSARNRAMDAESVARDEAARAQRESVRMGRLYRFMESMLAHPDPALGPPARTVEEVLAAAAQRLGEELGDDPELTAAIHFTLGRTYNGLDESKQAEPHLREAVRIRTDLFGPDDARALKAIDELAQCLGAQDRRGEAVALLSDAFARSDAHYGLYDATTVNLANTYANALSASGRDAEADALMKRALEGAIAVHGTDHPTTLTVRLNMGLRRMERGAFDEAREHLEAALAGRQRRFGDNHPATASALYHRAKLAAAQGEYEQAKVMFEAALERRTLLLGEDHSDTLRTMHHLAVLYREQHQNADAIAIYRRVLASSQRRRGLRHIDTLSTQHNLARALHEHGELAEAEMHYHEVIESLIDIRGPEHELTLESRLSLAALHLTQGRFEDAEAQTRQALEGFRRLLPPENPRRAGLAARLAACLIPQRRFEEAETILTEAAGFLAEQCGPDAAEWNVVLRIAGDLYTAWERPDALTLIERMRQHRGENRAD